MNLFEWYQHHKRLREMAKEREMWNEYCANWWNEHDIQYRIAFTEVKVILDEDIRYTRHWTA